MCTWSPAVLFQNRPGNLISSAKLVFKLSSYANLTLPLEVFKKYLFIYLAALSLSCGSAWVLLPRSMWDSTSPTRNPTGVSHITRQIFSLWTTSKVPVCLILLFAFSGILYLKGMAVTCLACIYIFLCPMSSFFAVSLEVCWGRP